MGDENKLVLCMILGNESKIIQRCLEQIYKLKDATGKRFLDGASFCCNGKDDTPDKIKEFFDKEAPEFPYQIRHHKWRSFSTNRSLSFPEAKVFVQGKGWNEAKTWCVLIDADMLFQINANFRKDTLKDKVYLLEQKHPIGEGLYGLGYQNVRLIRMDLEWVCKAITHEYWTAKDEGIRVIHGDMWIHDQDDGGNKADKYERDIALLERALRVETDPGVRQRYMFYLGQSYRCVKNFVLSNKFYRQRINTAGWVEEMYISMLTIGQNYLCMLNESKDEEERNQLEGNAVNWLLKAYEFIPGRNEALLNLVSHYNQYHQFDRAALFVSRALQNKKDPQYILFSDESSYTWKPLMEGMQAGFYSKVPSCKEMGRECTQKMLISRECPSNVRGVARANLKHYVKKFSEFANPTRVNIGEKFPSFKKDTTGRTYVPLNPSIKRRFITKKAGKKEAAGYSMIIRTVNYRQKGANNYNIADPDGKVRTTNYIMEVDDDIRITSTPREILYSTSETCKSHVIGLEDCRFIDTMGTHEKLLTSITCTSLEVIDGLPQICRVDLRQVGKGMEIQKLTHLKAPNEKGELRVEKNWLPFFDKKRGDLNFIYWYEPLTVIHLDDDGKLASKKEVKTKWYLGDQRGSAPPIEWVWHTNQGMMTGYLMLVHEVEPIIKEGRVERNYFSRFLFMDDNYEVRSISDAFIFEHLGVEFSSGMCLSHDGQHVIIGIGIEDSQAIIYKVKSMEINRMLVG